MSKKMGLSSLFRQRETTSLWTWPSCKHPKTDSFRWCYDDINKPVEPAHTDMVHTPESWLTDLSKSGSKPVEPAHSDMVHTPESWFTDSSKSGSFSTVSDESEGSESLECVLRGVRSDRFFFEPGDTKSILEEVKTVARMNGSPFEESVALAVESDDPYVDFLVSMEEMVETYGLNDWEWLMELLQWYLKMNGQKSHGFIVGAFVDLLVGIVSSSFEREEGSAFLFGNLMEEKL